MSASGQLLISDNIDFVDAFADGALVPGWSAFFGGSTDISYDFTKHKWTTRCVFLGTKEINEAIIDGVFGYAFDKAGSLIEVNLKDFYKNYKNYDKLLIPYVYAPVEFTKLEVIDKVK